MNSLSDQTAFPGIEGSEAAADSYGNPYTRIVAYSGMTMLQYYAGLAMQGLLASDHPDKPATARKIASWSVECAQALIAQLEGRAEK